MSVVTDLSCERAIQRSPDAAALACSLFTRYRHRVYRHCLYSLRSPHDAEDALQQTFVNALKALQAGTRPRVEGAWLLEIARNVCLERHRAARRRARHEITACPDSLDDLPSLPLPSDDQASDLGAALDCLDPRQREALLLREWRGLSYRETATALQLSQSAVESLLFRARRSLARALDDTRRLRGALNLGSLFASHRTFLSGAAVKTAAIVACCGVTVVAGPTLEHAVKHYLRPSLAAPAAQRSLHSRTAARGGARQTDIAGVVGDREVRRGGVGSSELAGPGPNAAPGATVAGANSGEVGGSIGSAAGGGAARGTGANRDGDTTAVRTSVHVSGSQAAINAGSDAASVSVQADLDPIDAVIQGPTTGPGDQPVSAGAGVSAGAEAAASSGGTVGVTVESTPVNVGASVTVSAH